MPRNSLLWIWWFSGFIRNASGTSKASTTSPSLIVSLKPGLHPRHRRQDAKAERGAVEIEIADRLDELALEADFLLGLAQRGIERRSVGRVDLAAGKGNLAGVVDRCGERCVSSTVGSRMIDHRDQHRRRPDRLLARDDLEHAVVAAVAGPRNDVGIDQAGRHVETQPRRAAREKFRRADRSRLHLLQHRLVQSASLTCFASAIAKNSPPDSIPNIGSPSTTRSSPMSTRS